jgi:CRISPR-associated protein Cas1
VKRILDLSGAAVSDDGPSVFRVRIDKGCLLISHGTEEDAAEARVPANEVEVLVLGPRLALTGAVLSTVLVHGGCVLSVDDRFRPAGMLLPIAAHHAHVERLRLQIESTTATRDRLWAQLVRAKINAQAALLGNEDAKRLHDLATRVEPGDPANIEAQAARLYWPALFGAGFRRSDDANQMNVLLNYGYAVLRAVVARAICATGLHPALGLHHHGRLNPFALADDLMEPARPIVVDTVVQTMGACALDRSAKRTLLSAILNEVVLDGEHVRLSHAYENTCRTLCVALTGIGDLALFESP